MLATYLVPFLTMVVICACLHFFGINPISKDELNFGLSISGCFVNMLLKKLDTLIIVRNFYYMFYIYRDAGGIFN